MEKPSNLLLKFSRRLFVDSVEQGKFVEALMNPQPLNPCILWCRDRPSEIPFSIEAPLSWQPSFVDRLAIGEQPGRHLLHDEGYYYCLDFSSIFAASVLLTITSPTELVFDMCAAPGGKSLFAQKALQPDQLISNEVIGKRMGALISNLRRCGATGTIALCIDSKILAEEIPQIADVVLVDAPCTGQSLLAKGENVPGCFHPVNINKNANRQKRILANSAQLVAPGGYLAYMTCAYSPEENEQVAEWLLNKFPQLEPIEIPHLASHQSHLAEMPCYRMWPQSNLGAGAFTILFRNTETGSKLPLPSAFLERPRLVRIW